MYESDLSKNSSNRINIPEPSTMANINYEESNKHNYYLSQVPTLVDQVGREIYKKLLPNIAHCISTSRTG